MCTCVRRAAGPVATHCGRAARGHNGGLYGLRPEAFRLPVTWRRPLLTVCRLPPQSHNVDACLSFLDARGVNVQGLSAEGKTDERSKVGGKSAAQRGPV